MSDIYIGLHVNYPLLLSDFNTCWIFSPDFENTQISNFMKIRPVRTKLFCVDGRTDEKTDRQTDMTKLIVAFRNFVNAHIIN